MVPDPQIGNPEKLVVSNSVLIIVRTGFSMDFPYDPQELFVFSLIGVVCGLGKPRRKQHFFYVTS